jgi:integrase
MPRKAAQPRIEVRRYELVDGTVTETYSIRYLDSEGRRRRITCASAAEAESERERLMSVLFGNATPPVELGDPARTPARLRASPAVTETRAGRALATFHIARPQLATGSIGLSVVPSWLSVRSSSAGWPAVEQARSVGPATIPARTRPAGPSIPVADEPTGMTLAEFWPFWISDAGARLQPKTVKGYERLFRARLAGRFGSLALDSIKPRMVSQWRAELIDGGTGHEAVRTAMILLQAIFTVAIEWGEAQANPVSSVRKPRQGRRRVAQPIAPEGVEALRAALWRDEDDFSPTLISVLAYAGLRPGEALGLDVRHIRPNTILVEQAVTDGELKLQKTGRLYRTVDLLAPLAGDLARWISRRGLTDPEAALFVRPDGGRWKKDDWDNWRNRRFFPAAKAVGLGRPRPYDLRHSFSSLLIREQRASIVDLAEQLGHASTMTLSTYGHVFAEHRRDEPVDIVEWIERARAEIAAQPD